MLAGLPVLEQLTAAQLPPIGENRAALIHMLRTRHIDTVLENCLRDGAAQVAILGAGLDTRAYRFRELKWPPLSRPFFGLNKLMSGGVVVLLIRATASAAARCHSGTGPGARGASLRGPYPPFQLP